MRNITLREYETATIAEESGEPGLTYADVEGL